jgi:6-phospho-beta-glucosidase
MMSGDSIPSRLKVCVVGGGSTYTPELVEGFALRDARLPIEELVLHDIDVSRLEVVGGLASRILHNRGWGGKLTLSSDLDESLEGCDFVITQLRVGGQIARLGDERMAVEHGCIGQETTGPGGFAKALRTVPIILDIAERVANRSNPRAWLVNFTNPVGIVTQALLDEGHRAIGLCNVAIGLQRFLASILDVEPERVELGHVGLNHLTWERSVLVDDKDRLPELMDRHLGRLADHLDLEASILQMFGYIPSYYLRYYYMSDAVLSEQQQGQLRAEEVMEIEDELLRMYADPNLDVKPALLSERGGAFYSEAAAQLVASLHDGAGDVQVVDVANGSAVPGIAPDSVVECSARIDRSGATPLDTGALGPEIDGLVHLVKSYEQLAAEAARTGDRRIALQALSTNPLVPNIDAAERLLEATLSINSRYLPRFFPQ